MTEKQYCLPEHLGIVSVKGQDATKLLHGQTTADFEKDFTGKAILGAACNPKGRAYGNFLAVGIEQDILLIMDRSIIDNFIKTLNKYAVFFKVELKDATKEFHLIGAFDNPSESEHFAVALKDKQLAIAFPGNRQLWLANPLTSGYEELLSSYEDKASFLEKAVWQAADIESGLPWIDADNIDKWIPQQINLHALEAVSFTKGCYTGQEIVARLNYRGKLKNWAHFITAETAIETLVIQNKDGKKVGEIINLVNHEDMHWALANLTESEAEFDLFLDQNGNPPCTLQNLPYTVKTSNS